MASVREWQGELYEIADRLEAGAARWTLQKDARDELSDLSDEAGQLRSDASWAALPHAEVAMELSKQVRTLAVDLEQVPELPKEEDDDADQAG